MPRATGYQKRIIRKLDLEKLVPLNTAPEKIDDGVLVLLLKGNINPSAFAEYWSGNARQHGVYVSTFLADIRNNLYNLFAN